MRLLSWTILVQYNRMSPEKWKREEAGEFIREKWYKRGKTCHCCLWRWKKEVLSQRTQAAPEAGNGPQLHAARNRILSTIWMGKKMVTSVPELQRNGFCLGISSKEYNTGDTVILALWGISDQQNRKTMNVSCLKALKLWWFVTVAAAENEYLLQRAWTILHSYRQVMSSFPHIFTDTKRYQTWRFLSIQRVRRVPLCNLNLHVSWYVWGQGPFHVCLLVLNDYLFMFVAPISIVLLALNQILRVLHIFRRCGFSLWWELQLLCPQIIQFLGGCEGEQWHLHYYL